MRSPGRARNRRLLAARAAAAILVAATVVLAVGVARASAGFDVLVSTFVVDDATGFGWSGAEVTGASAHDTAQLGAPQAGHTPSGTVTYSLFPNGSCTGAGTTTQTVTVAGDGSVPTSSTTGALPGGSYSFQAVYSGDSFYNGATSACEPFTVNRALAPVSTTVDDASNSPWGPVEGTGASAHDTATITGQKAGFPATGTVSYSFFTTGTCSGTPASSQVVVVRTDGSVPDSNSTGPLAAGSYAYEVTYSGDGNYTVPTPSCEFFQVQARGLSVTSTVVDEGTGLPWSGSESAGASAHDTAVINGQTPGIPPTGVVAYSFFSDGSCSTFVSSQPVTVQSNGSVPDSASTGPLGAGHYSYLVLYSGDANYSPSISLCEPFSVGTVATTVTTTVVDEGTHAPWSGAETSGASAHDSAVVNAQQSGLPASGKVTYSFFANGSCAGPPATTQTVTLAADGSVPDSASTGPLGSGSYAYQASYSGDSSYSAATGPCEPFQILSGIGLSTFVVDDATGFGWSGAEVTGASAHDTAQFSAPQAGHTPSGTVTYSFFGNNGCSGSPLTTQAVAVQADGTIPDSSSTGTLGAGSYAFRASYGGDGFYVGTTSPCEPFSVGRALPSASTTVIDDVTHSAWSGGEATGASAHDSSVIGGQKAGFPATGTVTYSFFGNSSCGGSPTSTQTVAVGSGGTVPDSSSTGPLSAGGYSYQAGYSGDGNYSATTGLCEPFQVQAAGVSVTTSVIDNATGLAWSGTETAGASAHDTASIGGQKTGLPATGTVTYSFFTDGGCTSFASSQTVTVHADGTVPPSSSTGPLAAGSYSYLVGYGGDANYLPTTSPCEPFTVSAPAQVSQITPTDTTCQQFAAGTATTLSSVSYSTKGSTILQTNPGVIFYWVKLSVASAGAQQFTITQSTTYSPTSGTPYFSVASGSFAYDGGCNSLSTKITTAVAGGTSSTTVKFTAKGAGTYYVGLKLSTNSVVGSGPASTVTGFSYPYTFATTGVAGSTSGLSLTRK